MGLGLLFPLLLLWTRGTQGATLDPTGQHVCTGSSPSEIQCCPGWKQKDQECSIPICEGPDACRKDEVCVKPGFCRCKPGFFGAHCSSRCPGQYWGPDCREICPCYPRGQCEPATGVCQCQPSYWGRLCEFTCSCGPHGQCDPKTGLCRCDPGWWSPTCRRPCQCNPAARCDQATGACVCPAGWWGRRCSFSCQCHTSPCLQDTGRCTCLPGWWGPDCSRSCQCVRGQCSGASGHCSCPPGFHGARCELPCGPGRYGVQCRESCGHCEQNATCSPVTGNCESCRPGWNGTQCKQPCPPGTFGESCTERCPRCRLGEPCHVESGYCQRCDPGRQGRRCEKPCPLGTFGEGCSSTCPACGQGTCDPLTGECVCSAGYWGTSCNSSCPSGFHGNNCSLPCQCPEGLCHPVSGACQLGRHGRSALIAGILVPVLLLLMGISCCAYCCSTTRLDPKDRPERNGAALFRMKQQVWGALTSLGSALPCGSLSNYKLPWVTVSHHDPEVPFNHSFIEPPSAGWASDDSFSSDPDSGEEDEAHAYFMPPREETVPVTQEEPPAASLPGGPFPSPEDASTPFPIPRTSSLARAKRPSVSFAEGTKFAPQNGRSSADLSSPVRKPKRLSKGAHPRPESQEAEESAGLEQANAEGEAPTATSPRDAAASHHQLPCGSQTVAECVESADGGIQEGSGSVATIYMLAGTPQKPEGPVWSVFRHLGNCQKEQAAPKVKSVIPKPLRRSLGRNQGSPGPGSAPGAVLSRVMESTAVRSGEESRGQGDGTESLGTVQEPVAGNSSQKQGSQKQAEEKEQEEPLYENVGPMSVPPQH
ncbi:scavenger receptor class F member 1 [Meriones unguiculatus]|uniref:scavenger receptor class F member 1 n=1 Tax=Meriones unguiculatus TaxID=10047 RepID=UPI000B4EEF59|nr:scavenger receptor class F member 1 [Meriones unguiculatus]